MATIVYQGLQSCLESQILESRTLRLRLSAPKPQFPNSFELSVKPCFPPEEKLIRSQKSDNNAAVVDNSGGWESIQSLSTNTSQLLRPASYYTQRSISALSDKSLELCTENLGSETGSDDVTSVESLFSPSWWGSESGGVQSVSSPATESGSAPATVEVYDCSNTKPKTRSKSAYSARRKSAADFPPPLTTMSGPELIRVRPHREGGRLVMEAVKSHSAPSCFKAERIDGRLRLRVVVEIDVAVNENACESAGVTADNAEEESEIRIREEVTEGRKIRRHDLDDENVSSNHGGLLNSQGFRVAATYSVIKV
ncbi:Protein FANTASTIC FOUR 3 [Linum grandiflorum]